MSWVNFFVKEPHANSKADGQLEFVWTINESDEGKPLTGTLSYRINEHAPARILLTITTLPVNSENTYTPAAVTFTPQNKVNIPKAGDFGGGNYNTLSNMVFTPSATSPQTSGTFAGTFSNTPSPEGSDDPFDWQANVTTPVPEPAEAYKKAGY